MLLNLCTRNFTAIAPAFTLPPPHPMLSSVYPIQSSRIQAARTRPAKVRPAEFNLTHTFDMPSRTSLLLTRKL